MANKIEKEVEKIAKEAEKEIEVVLVNAKQGIHTVYHRLGATEFADGVAKVSAEVKKELKEIGLIK